MKRILLAVIQTLFSVYPASAQRLDWKPIMAVAAGQMADAVVTHDQITTPTLHCAEANPLLGAHPSAA